MKGKKWLIVLLVLLLAVAVAVGAFWDTIIMYLAPKTVLTAAVSEALNALQQRSENSPLWILAEGYDENGRNAITLDLTVEGGVPARTHYDMTVQTDLSENQLLAEGTVTADGKALDVTAYLDREAAALTSNDLLGNSWYGITYDTFGTDIRSFALLDFFVPDTILADWEGKIDSLKEFMNRSYTLPQIPDFTREDINKAMLGLLALKCQVSSEPIVVNGLTLEAYRISYNVAGAQVGEILSPLLPGADSKSRIEAYFYLCEKSLIKAHFKGTAGEESVDIVLNLGLDASSDDLSFTLGRVSADAETTLSIALSTQQADGRYGEVIRIGDTEISYDWDPQTGDMNLTLPDREPIALTLREAENGFTVVTKDFAKLIGINSEKAYDCTMTVAKGAQIVKPEYRNLDQWSWEDLLVLLSGVGSLIGLNLK